MRPNVQTAKGSGMQTVGDYASHNSFLKTKSGRFRVFTSDWCDTCLEVKFCKKWQLSMRVRGWKFICKKCARENNIDPYDKKNKLFLVLDARPGAPTKAPTAFQYNTSPMP